jgi:predicted DNA-binding antitoxin AbrB/MazE fold protein
MTIHATYRNGVFTPSEPVDLPDGAEVNVDVHIVQGNGAASPAMAKVYEILSRRHDGGQRDLAERHDEHQP